MVRTQEKSLDAYITRIEGPSYKENYPDLTFEVVKHSDRWATIYYRSVHLKNRIIQSSSGPQSY